jgi:hypothetical protein
MRRGGGCEFGSFALISQVEFWENFPKMGDRPFSADALRHWRQRLSRRCVAALAAR